MIAWIRRMAIQYSPAERLEFGLRWECIRCAYYESLGWKSRVSELNAKIDRIQYDLNQIYSECDQ